MRFGDKPKRRTVGIKAPWTTQCTDLELAFVISIEKPFGYDTVGLAINWLQ
jgi:hypothetical protein